MVLNKQENAKFGFRIMAKPLDEFDVILTHYRVWSLLGACKKPMYFVGQITSFYVKKEFFIFVFLTKLNANRWNSLKLDPTLIFTVFCPVLWEKTKLILYIYFWALLKKNLLFLAFRKIRKSEYSSKLLYEMANYFLDI